MIGFVVLNYRTYDDSKELITSLSKVLDRDDVKIVIVDNESTNEKLSKLIKKIDRLKLDVTYISSKENIGFAKGMNLGILKAKELGCDFVICSNNDIIIPDDFSISELKSSYYQNDNCFIIAPRVLNLEGREQNPLYKNDPFPPSIKTQLLKTVFLIPFLGRWLYLARGLLKYFLDKESVESDKLLLSGDDSTVFAVHGAFFMITPHYFKHYDCLDSKTFLYFEELIIAKRVSIKGGVQVVNNKFHVIHKEDSSTNSKFEGDMFKKEMFILRENYRSLNYFIQKYI